MRSISISVLPRGRTRLRRSDRDGPTSHVFGPAEGRTRVPAMTTWKVRAGRDSA
jgi:hypothetical protein